MDQSTASGGSFGIGPLSRLRRTLSHWFQDRWDLVPPYLVYEGRDWGSRSRGDRFFLEIGDDLVEVDRVTFGLLEPGETIKVRYTRRLRAINVDRFAVDPAAPVGPARGG